MTSGIRYMQGIKAGKLELGCWMATVKFDRDSGKYRVTVKAAAGHELIPEEIGMAVAKRRVWDISHTDDQAAAFGHAKLMLEANSKLYPCPACCQGDDAAWDDAMERQREERQRTDWWGEDV